MHYPFKVGDKIRRIGDSSSYITVGKIYTVRSLTGPTSVCVQEIFPDEDWPYETSGFELVSRSEVAPSISAARVARQLAETKAAGMEDQAEAKMEATVTILRSIEAPDVEYILNQLRARHRDTLSRQEYYELDAVIKKLEGLQCS